MDPRNGRLLAVAGVGFSALQPPGSTMKIVTATAALEAGAVKLSTVFPPAGAAVIDGYTLHNAGGEVCGGTFLNAFAVSCNSVFAPLGAKVGARRFVDVAERFGFNQAPSIPGAAESQIPPAHDIGSALAVGSSAIGQGKVLASTLEMTDVAATIAMGGRRPLPTLQAHQPASVRARHAAAHRPAGADDDDRRRRSSGPARPRRSRASGWRARPAPPSCSNTNNPNDPNANSPQNTDSWFVGYAPVGKPRVGNPEGKSRREIFGEPMRAIPAFREPAPPASS